MPAMYPEELRSLREQNPGLQYDFRGRLIDDGGYGESLRGWSPYKQDYGLQNPYGDLAQDVSNLFYGYNSVVDQDWNRYYRPKFGNGVGDALSSAMQGLDGFNYQPESGEQYGPSLPGMPRPGQHLTLPEPNAGFYSQWNSDTNSWVRHGSPSDGATASRPRTLARQNSDPYGLRNWSPYVNGGDSSRQSQLPENLQYGLV